MSKKKQCFQGKDSFCRMNFLLQASMLMAKQNQTLSAYYGNLCKNIGKKAVLRMDPELKRKFCKKCSLALEPGITAELSVTKKPNNINMKGNYDEGTYLQVNCLKCCSTRKFKINSDYKFWLENPQSVVDVIKFPIDSSIRFITMSTQPRRIPLTQH